MSSFPAEREGSQKLTEEEIIYIRQILGQLRRLSNKDGAEMLCYLIDMAYIEAGDLQTQVLATSVGKG
ncbi:hypothetical protein K7H91_23725 [Martelella mediterranea]|uniref:Uncharacterized protein n=1 Tax=Martelella mediterranea DSM 17316 TaxID=1122214 RepID=A0A1U9Z6K2_9HYPH|nr:hypothetical protein Mame_04045 [Martelella mediterranea DSM 17316]MAU23121.1 hypothetical protein [Martelella sp.]MCD1636768.1 hypothetical protein [Martelella mediterranea]|tara:strand:+ start:118 stop:321 length:204 start_codon:yes stop_codon:yes gene_type:complete